MRCLSGPLGMQLYVPANCQRQEDHVPCALRLAPIVIIVNVSKVVALIVLGRCCSLPLAGQQRGVFIGTPLFEHTLGQSLDSEVGIRVGLLRVKRRTVFGCVPRVRGIAVGGRRCAHGVPGV
jgi:hypothetical protein